jgi:predicted dehydrogenase
VGKISACDPMEAAREAMASLHQNFMLYDDYDTALRAGGFDAVFVTSPTAMHLEMIEKALNAGANVFVEKPLANTSEGVARIKELAEEKGLAIMVGFCFRYHEVLLKAKKIVESGRIGRLVNICAHMGEPFAEIQPNYLNMYYSKYSGAFELVHDLDLALWFSDQKVTSVHAVYGSFSDMGMQSPDSIELLLKFEDRMAANVHLNFYQHPRTRRIELQGVDGTVSVEFASWDEATLSVWATDTREWESATFPTKRNDMFRDEDSEFLNAIMTNGQIACTVDEALKSLSVIEQVYRPDSI